MSPHGCAVIIGAGQAGLTAAVSLRERGWLGAIDLFGEELSEPYQRPPLSKGYLSGFEAADTLTLRSSATLNRDRIRFHPGKSALELRPSEQTVAFADGTMLGYDVLVLATGASARRLAIPGIDLPGVHTLRSVGDADALRHSLDRSTKTVIVGGGFVGLEIAASAAAATEVTVVEVETQLLRRAVSEPIALNLGRALDALGVRIVYEAVVAEIRSEAGIVTGVTLTDGRVIDADTVVVAVGAVPNVDLAQRAGLTVDNGIVTDSRLRTSDPSIRAIGDCARYPNVHADTMVRLESVQNATDQARYVAEDIISGVSGPYNSTPWFWSKQGAKHLQIAGIAIPSDATVVLVDTGKMVVTRNRGDRIVAVETLNNPGTHVRARRMLKDGPFEAARLDELVKANAE